MIKPEAVSFVNKYAMANLPKGVAKALAKPANYYCEVAQVAPKKAMNILEATKELKIAGKHAPAINLNDAKMPENVRLNLNA